MTLRRRAKLTPNKAERYVCPRREGSILRTGAHLRLLVPRAADRCAAARLLQVTPAVRSAVDLSILTYPIAANPPLQNQSLSAQAW